MTVSKDALVNGFIHYVQEKVLPVMNDNCRVVGEIAISAVSYNTEPIEKLLNNEMVLALIGNGDMVDLTKVQEILSDVAKTGNLKFTIPRVPLLNKVEKELRFNDDDVRQLVDIIAKEGR